jgi:hypothetical protein
MSFEICIANIYIVNTGHASPQRPSVSEARPCMAGKSIAFLPSSGLSPCYPKGFPRCPSLARLWAFWATHANTGVEERKPFPSRDKGSERTSACYMDRFSVPFWAYSPSLRFHDIV